MSDGNGSIPRVMELIAHRGSSGHAPENTLASFRLALEQGAKAVELDVHQSKDHELVVIHDEDLKRVGRRKDRVGDLTAAELSRCDVGSWFDGRFAAEGVPTLEAVYDAVDGRAQIHVEIKRGSSLYPGIEERVVELIRRRRAWDRTVVSSFDHKALYMVRSLDERVRLGYLLGLTPLPKAWTEMKELKAESLNLSQRQTNARRLRACHQRGLRMRVYTVNTERELARLSKLGVDGVFTNFPELQA